MVVNAVCHNQERLGFCLLHFFDEGVCFTARGNEQIDSDFTVQRMVDDDVMHFAAVVDDYFKFFFDAVLIISMAAADSFQ